MSFDPDMRLAYADDATSIETHVDIVGPDGTREGFVCDNLTTVMYFLVSHDLRPTREGLRELGRIRSEGTLMGESLAEMLNTYRDRNSLPLALFIEVEGDPNLTKEFTS